MKANYFVLYRFYNEPVIRVVRFAALIGLSAFLVISYSQVIFPFLLVLYNWFLINEIFIYFKINKSYPSVYVSKNQGSFEEALLFKTRKILVGSNNFTSIIHKLKGEHDVRFFSDKLGGYSPSPVVVDKSTLIAKAGELAQKVKGIYITPSDVFAAYLLLTEDKTKTLLEKELSEKDLLEILIWTREKFHLDIKKSIKLHFTGYGVFDFFIYGWDTIVKEYSYDITYNVVNKNDSPIVGRESEFNQMVAVLSKNTTNNVLLIGPPGVGKSSLVKKLALDSYRDSRFVLTHVKVYELLADRILAGVQNSGELESRLSLLLAELEHAGNIILFIQNMENIFGGGGFAFDMSGVLFQYLKSGRVQIIGTTTPAFYKSTLEKKTSIINLFERIQIEEPPREAVFQMIAAHVNNIEDEYGISVSYKAIQESVELSTTYLPDVYLPGKAVNLLQDAASRVRLSGKHIVEKNDVTKVIQEKTHIILEKPTGEEKKTLLSLEDELHKRVIGQSEAIDAVAKAIRRLRSGFSQHNRPISVFLFLGSTGVGKTETARALASVYFGDENAMIRLDMSEYQTQNEVERLLGGIPGGVDVGSSLPEAVHQHPFSLLLLDEFEKAHPHILDIFLQVFEDGRLTDNQGRTVSFKNTIIIATSNAGSELIREMVRERKSPDETKQILVESLLENGQYKPELLNRFDDVIVFKPLTVEEAGQIAKLLLSHSLKTLEDEQIYLSSSDQVIEKIVRESYDEEAGARNMRRYIGSTVEDFISRLILEDKLPRGTHATLTTDSGGSFVIQ